MSPLWENITIDIAPGEFIAILGPNGVGKSTFLKAIIGSARLTHGRIDTTASIGFIPQQRMFPPELPLRARDLVGLATAHGVFRRRRAHAAEVDELLARVGASHLADRRVGSLSGGQQQLVRQAQALANNPELLLCDEPLLSLDFAMQSRTIDLIDSHRRTSSAAVLFVTHSINPILNVVDKVLYLGPTGHTFGPVDEVMTSETLSELYGTHMDVVRVGDRLVVL